MRIVRDKLSTESIPGNLLGLYLAELSHKTGEIIEATIDNGGEVAMAITLADMLDIVYGCAAQVGISRTDLTNLRMQRHTEYGDYTNHVSSSEK